jgi:hypothetical protein
MFLKFHHANMENSVLHDLKKHGNDPVNKTLFWITENGGKLLLVI